MLRSMTYSGSAREQVCPTLATLRATDPTQPATFMAKNREAFRVQAEHLAGDAEIQRHEILKRQHSDVVHHELPGRCVAQSYWQ